MIDYQIKSKKLAQEAIAPGWPGITVGWTSSAKTGVGTALNVGSEVWFTMSQGILNEIYYPKVDQACTRDLGLIITCEEDNYFSEEKLDCHHKVNHIVEGVPAYKVINTCKDKQYKIEKEIISDPARDTVLQHVTFTPLRKKNFRIHVLLAPHIGNTPNGNHAWVAEYKGIKMLFAERNGIAMAMGCSTQWKKASVGFVGFSDGWQDLNKHKKMQWEYKRADNGNVALTAEVQANEDGPTEFTIFLGFGRTWSEAGQNALGSQYNGFEAVKHRFLEEWTTWQKNLFIYNANKKSSKELYLVSTSILRIHESKRFSKGLIASLSIPWGFIRSETNLGGYHLVWPRDMVQTAGGLLAANAGEDALKVLNYLMITQEMDGHWAQNMWLDGTPYWDAIQMDQTGAPLMLVDLAKRNHALNKYGNPNLWRMILKAVNFIISKGPATDQDRWEENSGYSPYTLAIQISALLIGAEYADENNKPEIAEYLRETADTWNESIERWTYVTNTPLSQKAGVEGYYVRIASPDVVSLNDHAEDIIRIANLPEDRCKFDSREIVSPDALSLVRYGLRSPSDQRILNTIKVIDQELKVTTPFGDSWKRYNHDGYGEQADGSPYNGVGQGRPWPLLTGERAHYEIAAGNFPEARKLMEDIENFANEGGMIPEQIWDQQDIPENDLYFGKPTGAAMPLVWAHAEYIKLSRSLKEKKVFDMPLLNKKRYVENQTEAKNLVWRFSDQIKYVPNHKIFRIETLSSCLIRYSTDGWNTFHESYSKWSGIGMNFADFELSQLNKNDQFEFTFYWLDSGEWENQNFNIIIS